MLFITSLDPSQGTGARENQKEKEHLTRIFQIIWICNHKNKQPVEHLKNSNNNSKRERERNCTKRMKWAWKSENIDKIADLFLYSLFFYSALFLCQHLTIAHLLFHLFSYKNPQKKTERNEITIFVHRMCPKNEMDKEWTSKKFH